MQVLWLFGLSLFVVLGFMTLVWIFYRFNKNAGIVDLAWAFSFIITLGISYQFGEAPFISKALLIVLVFPWAFRLFWHLTERFNFKVEDPRYTKIRENWGGDPSGLKFLGMFLTQGVLVAVISLPFYIIASDWTLDVGIFSIIGFIVAIISFFGESIADKQLRVFKKNPDNRGRICDRGLWSMTRHPNYFFEWMFWVGIFIFALDSDYGYLAIISPAIMYYLLRYLSGIPMLEAYMARSKKEAWEIYKARVPEFFPRIF